MRKFVWLLALAGSAVGVNGAAGQGAQPAPSLAPGMKIGYVHSARLFQEAPGATEARTTFQREMDKYRAELALLEDSIKNMVTEYQQKQVMLSPDAKKKQEDAINAKQRVYDQRSQQIEQLASKRQQELVGPIMTRINSILETIRKEEGYVIILDASQAGVIVSADTTLDLTAKVLAKLKTAAPASGVPKAPGK